MSLGGMIASNYFFSTLYAWDYNKKINRVDHNYVKAAHTLIQIYICITHLGYVNAYIFPVFMSHQVFFMKYSTWENFDAIQELHAI
jgi:hypothetical protein